MSDRGAAGRPRRPERLKVYFDGGCRPNPGKIEIAVVLRGTAYFRDDVGSGDNNRAEWLALLHALDLARAAGAGDVLLIGDSAVAIARASAWPGGREGAVQAHRAFVAASAEIARVRLRRVARTQNLAGIALARRRNLP